MRNGSQIQDLIELLVEPHDQAMGISGAKWSRLDNPGMEEEPIDNNGWLLSEIANAAVEAGQKRKEEDKEKTETPSS